MVTSLDKANQNGNLSDIQQTKPSLPKKIKENRQICTSSLAPAAMSIKESFDLKWKHLTCKCDDGTN